ncbi:MAG: cobalamin B12-binding domain-containing protein, partial [Planctomycetes bacterium]|nr:cobalamin B12-binding domain-containing protein [Planctomycetota bacterium]
MADGVINRIFPTRSIKRVLFIAPPDADASMFDYATAKRGRYWNFPPYGLGVIAAHIRNDGIDVRIINLNNEVLKACKLSISEGNFDFDDVWKTSLSRSLKDFQPDIAGVTCMFTQTHRSAVEVCDEIKKFNPALPVAVGGVHITNCFADNKASDLLLNDFE